MTLLLAIAVTVVWSIIGQVGIPSDALTAVYRAADPGFSQDGATLSNPEEPDHSRHGLCPYAFRPCRTIKLQEDTLDYDFYLPFIEDTPESTIYYVSKTGDNTDGKSWITAWNELEHINWEVIKPGDTILLDGGKTEMVYSTTLTIEKKGTPAQPITIALADEPDRDGRVVIFGGRSTPLPYCGQVDYTYDDVDVNRSGILLDQASWIVIDGRKWSGIVVHGHNRDGVRLEREWNNPNYPLNEHITFRGLEIFDNGNAWQSAGVWQPDGWGVGLSGRHITFERTLIHDNGADAIVAGGAGGIIEDITLHRVWLYNQRPHPTEPNEVFNYCIHSDGMQIYGGGNQYGLTVEDSIIGPGFMQGLLLGAYGTDAWIGTVHDVTIRNTLIVGHHGESATAALKTQYDPDSRYPNDPPTNYVIDRVTIVRDIGLCCGNIWINGWGHTIVDSVSYGGQLLRVDGNPVVSNFYWWQSVDLSGIGTEVDPMFVDGDYPGVGDGFADFNFEIQNPEISGAGSSITSPDKLLED